MTAVEFLEKLISKNNLTKEESVELAGIMFSEEVPASVKAGLLVSLRMKGETTDEMIGFIKFIRRSMVKVKAERTVIDTCGNGGDGQNTFNISTATALVSAGCGVTVAKHGNRSVSSKSGSADVLEALGININLSKDEAEESLRRTNFTFLFAPNFHPIFKNAGAVRRELGIKTIFNLLGPLLNPAGVRRQIVGTSSIKAAEILSKVVQKLDSEHVLVIHSDEGMDEVSIYKPTTVFEIKKGKIKKITIKPSDFGLSGINRKEISAFSADESKDKVLKVLKGEKGDCRNIVLINSGAALYVSGKYKNMKEGIAAAEKAIDSGKAMETLNNFVKLSNNN